uniref:Uncharacterized protein n=1 Tax=viral metagenome TaxID=1070528 RepID=A0A6C0EKE9_9ZZZZ
MPILKFWFRNDQVVLDNYRLENITSDRRTQLLDKKSFMQDHYRIGNKVYMVLNDLFFKMSKIFNRNKTPISAMLIEEDGSHIIIVPSRSYVFYEGRSVEPCEYHIFRPENEIRQLLR